MWGPGTWRKFRKVQERSGDDHHSSTYVICISAVGVEGRVMDDKSSMNVDGSSVLEVVCGAPGIGGKFRKFLGTSTHARTSGALLEINSVS